MVMKAARKLQVYCQIFKMKNMVYKTRRDKLRPIFLHLHQITNLKIPTISPKDPVSTLYSFVRDVNMIQFIGLIF
jgi:hypothetical protein